MTEGNGLAPTGPTVGAGLSAVGGAGYRFDPDQIAALIPKWEQLRDGIEEDYRDLQTAAGLARPPTGDQPARQNADQTKASILTAMTHNRAMKQYSQAWIDTLRKANGTYVENEDATRRGLDGGPGRTDGHGLY